jgi:carbon storage regulator
MLSLSRNLGESLIIGNTITVQVVAIYKHKVKLGIEAPRDVPVHRKEVQEAIDKEAATDAVGADGSAPVMDDLALGRAYPGLKQEMKALAVRADLARRHSAELRNKAIEIGRMAFGPSARVEDHVCELVDVENVNVDDLMERLELASLGLVP